MLLLPDRYSNNEQVIHYLFGRGIDLQIIQECIDEGILFESAGRYHNAVFVGKDEKGVPRYAAYRGLGGNFRLDASGSDKRYSFRLLADKPSSSVHLFEAAIDLLSYATYLKCEEKDYKGKSTLFVGVYQPKKELKDSTIPIALSTFLKANTQIKTLYLHLDNDNTGRRCTAALKVLLQKTMRSLTHRRLSVRMSTIFVVYLGIGQQKNHRERGDAR